MPELVRVDDRADAPDLALGDVYCQHPDDPLLPVDIERAGPSVDLDRPYRHVRKAVGQAEPVDQAARDAIASMQRAGERWNLAAAVAGQLDVVSEQRLEPGEIAVLRGGQELPRQLVL